MTESNPRAFRQSEIEDLTVADIVYRIIGAIPHGCVATYGDIARAAGIPRSARRVGWLLNRVPDELDLPCHRVVNRQGELSGGWAFGHPDIMRALLEEEAIEFVDRYRVDLQKHRWDIQPSELPPPTK